MILNQFQELIKIVDCLNLALVMIVCFVSQNSKIRLLHIKQIDITELSVNLLKPTGNFTYHQVEH
jgi:hypothetical protein